MLFNKRPCRACSGMSNQQTSRKPKNTYIMASNTAGIKNLSFNTTNINIQNKRPRNSRLYNLSF